MDKEIILGVAVAVLFFVVSQKKVYDMTNKYVSDELDELGCPTQKGLLVHAVVAGLLFYGVNWLVKNYVR
jgi:hypothetical protein